ncbi:AAA family ATPase [Mesorhizobium sp. M1182]|uniref:AAA family ATPase n=1 Tax=unclassified Mesorhizobium TaxID=325217 RepID=UPI00333BF617
MRLNAIGLRNWKSYRRFRLDIPYGREKPVALIEGNNGSGKTSLLEAFVLCLYGRLGIPLLARANSVSRVDRSYERFMERALNSGARQGRAQIAIEITFQSDDNEYVIERIWHFVDGALRKNDEEVRIFQGADRIILASPDPEDDERFVRDFVDQNILQDNLAGFFILDGEHLERMASINMDGQVKTALEAAIGIDRLHRASADLRTYARERRRNLPDNAAATAEARLALNNLGREIEERATSVELLLAVIGPLRERRDDVVSRIGRLHGDSYRAFKTHFEQRESVIRERDALRDELRRLLSGELAQALAGETLRTAALERIEAEHKAAQVKGDEERNLNRASEFVDRVSRHTTVTDDVARALALAWREMWGNRTADAGGPLLSHLGETDRLSVAEHLRKLSSVSASDIRDLARAVSRADERIGQLDRALGEQKGTDDESKSLAEELNGIQEELARAEARHAMEAAALRELEDRRSCEEQQLAAVSLGESGNAVALKRSAAADRAADLIDALADAAVPQNLDALSAEITDAYRSMAHKTVVEQIKVNEEGRVTLLDRSGRDLHELDASAGENHIFTLSLMSALARLAADFPIIMDSPFARLDAEHRRRVIGHFTEMDRQLVLLVHPAELHPGELALVTRRSGESLKLPSTERLPVTGAAS